MVTEIEAGLGPAKSDSFSSFFHIVFLGFLLKIPYLYDRFFEVLIEKRQLAAWIVVVVCCGF